MSYAYICILMLLSYNVYYVTLNNEKRTIISTTTSCNVGKNDGKRSKSRTKYSTQHGKNETRVTCVYISMFNHLHITVLKEHLKW